MTELDPLRDLARMLAEQSDAHYRPGPVAGGRKNVTVSIGTDDCWCGRPANHDWVGREDGAPHPRYPD